MEIRFVNDSVKHSVTLEIIGFLARIKGILGLYI